MDKSVFKQGLNNGLGFFLLLVLSLLLSWIFNIASLGIGFGIIILILGLPIAAYMLNNFKFGLYLVLFISSCMSVINRVLYAGIPFGLIIDFSLILVFLAIVNELIQPKSGVNVKSLKSPITTMVLVWAGYLVFQVVNPEGAIAAWVNEMRSMIRIVMIYIIMWRVFDSFSNIKRFTNVYLLVGLLAALYGIYQDIFGLPSFDLSWATANPRRINLLYIGGQWRKFSFLTDPAAFGMFMVLIAVVSAFLAIESTTQTKKRLWYVLVSLAAILGMFASDIRTAYAMLPVGGSMYVALNITKRRTWYFVTSAVLVFLLIYFGPFHNSTIHRFRTAFNPGEDASMQVRDINRKIMQPYIYSHPIGGGPSTSGVPGEQFAPGHYLKGFPPDGGFMKTLLELGWIGLLIEMTLYLTVLVLGIDAFFKSKSPEKKSYYLAYIVGFFVLTVAFFAKKSPSQFPINFFLYGAFAVIVRLREFERNGI